MIDHKRPQATEFPRTMTSFLFVGALIFLYLRTFLIPAIPFVEVDDQTLFFARAVHILHGEVIYRDFFELVTPGTDLLYAAAFRLFGIHAWIMQAWSIFVGIAFLSVITRIAKEILSGPLVLLPGMLFLVFDFNGGLDMTHQWYSTLAALAAVGLLTKGTSLLRVSVAGSLCGIAIVFTQTKGALTFAALIIYLLWLNRFARQQGRLLKQLAALALPFFSILLCVLGYYIIRRAFAQYFLTSLCSQGDS